jgi:phosphoesterase RecJ-like protein
MDIPAEMGAPDLPTGKGASDLPDDKIERLREMLSAPAVSGAVGGSGDSGVPGGSGVTGGSGGGGGIGGSTRNNPGGKNILVVSHYNPDGDALGSSIAWAQALERMGHRVMCVVPNRFPYFLEWMPGVERINVYSDRSAAVDEFAAEADLVCCLDFNSIGRLEGLAAAIEANARAQKLLIDHHLSPPEGYFDLAFSYPEACSTSYVVYKLIARLAGPAAIDRDMGTVLYVGMMTDTGGFSYSFLSPDLFRVVAELVEVGIDIPYINKKIYNSYGEGRVRLLSYALGPKMQVFEDGRAAVISLKESELRRFAFRQGDSEGFVNYPLSIESMKISALLVQNHRSIRVSLRSRGDVDVNLFARRYFDGGGHRNAAGGKSTDSMERTIERYRAAVAEYFRDEGME